MTDMQRKTVDAIDNGFSASAVGGLLRQARERSGESLASTAQQLRIRESYLQAIEQGDFRRLPGATYAVGFVRSYADHLGLDPQEIVRRFREEVDDLGRRTALSFPSVAAEAKIPGGVILLIAAFVALVGYGGWYYLSERDDSIAALVPEVPLAMQQPA
ncbi:MAG: helix-turn-helix domain-containing protein, partial [Dongiaceae bacterium]